MGIRTPYNPSPLPLNWPPTGCLTTPSPYIILYINVRTHSSVCACLCAFNCTFSNFEPRSIPKVHPSVRPSRSYFHPFVSWWLRGLGFDWLLTFNRKIDVMQLVLQLNRLMIAQQKQKPKRCAKRALYSQQELFNGTGCWGSSVRWVCVLWTPHI